MGFPCTIKKICSEDKVVCVSCTLFFPALVMGVLCAILIK